MLGAFRAVVRPRAHLVIENLALRQQLAVLRQTVMRPRLRPVDRAFWAVLSRTWSRWTDALIIVKPATVVSWHRRAFARFWAHKSCRLGRPPLDAEIVDLIGRMARENSLWSRRRIAGELAKLGYEVGNDTVARYMPIATRRSRGPSSHGVRAASLPCPASQASTIGTPERPETSPMDFSTTQDVEGEPVVEPPKDRQGAGEAGHKVDKDTVARYMP